jgi:hypothetical protein
MHLTAMVMIPFLSLSMAAQASLLKGAGQGKSVEGVTVSTDAKLDVGGRSHSLKLIGAGLRYKKVAFIKAKVYVGELFVEAPEKFQKSADGAASSVDSEKSIAMRMTFLRDVGGDRISGGFKEALETNKVNMDTPSIKSFLDAVKAGGEAKDKTTLIVAGEKLPNGKEAVTFENSAGSATTVVGDAGFIRDVFSMWLGKTDDSGVENLKNQILGL